MSPLYQRMALAGAFGGVVGLLGGLTQVPWYITLPIGLALGMAIGKIPVK